LELSHTAGAMFRRWLPRRSRQGWVKHVLMLGALVGFCYYHSPYNQTLGPHPDTSTEVAAAIHRAGVTPLPASPKAVKPSSSARVAAVTVAAAPDGASDDDTIRQTFAQTGVGWDGAPAVDSRSEKPAPRQQQQQKQLAQPERQNAISTGPWSRGLRVWPVPESFRVERSLRQVLLYDAQRMRDHMLPRATDPACRQRIAHTADYIEHQFERYLPRHEVAEKDCAVDTLQV
jgi:hypothetical protein